MVKDKPLRRMERWDPLPLSVLGEGLCLGRGLDAGHVLRPNPRAAGLSPM